MKNNYEKNTLIIAISIIFIIIFLISLLSIFNTRYRKYKILDSIAITENYLEVFVLEEDYKLLKSSKYVFIDNKRYKREIISVQKDMIKRDKKKYHEIIMRIKYSKKYKDNDVVRLTIYDNKEKVINIFRACWKED